ncbi:glycoside hydrolase family 36 protein [Neobacillus sp. NPDC093127]|uniref:glycoside hydrolase family 36 protein n=1 Tax=Neobacillus sp. NPDC093127 TaxID=3364296 RepID=UPI003801045A
MSQIISLSENRIHVAIEVTGEMDVRLLHFSSLPYDEATHKNAEQRKRCRLVEVQVTGENQDDHHGSKHTRTNPGFLLEYKDHRDFRNHEGRKLEIELEKDGLIVISHIQFYDNVSVVRAWTELINKSESSKGIEFVSSFALSGIEKEGLRCWSETSRLYIPHNTWYGEMQWRKYSLPELGLSPVNNVTLKRIAYNSAGTWSSSEILPMGCFENLESGSALIWQIEHNGSWHWELGEQAEHLYIQLSGPTENESHWWKELKPGATFTSVTAAVGVSCEFEKAIGELTKYRRLIRRENEDNKKLPVIFNDYANCLDGDPTTQKLKPLIDAAAEVGCEIFCIDAGWYSDGDWWEGVGEWQPSNVRFPGGIEEPLNYIRSKGMIPGLWLEIEVMGIHCPLAKMIPDDWFFVRHGKRIIDHGRYQLDFRNSAVVKYADQIIDRLVNEYGAGYIKMDYNINGGIGTELYADSFGDGLLEHNRAYLKWIDSIFKRYPELIIENCGSGGMRMDYAMLSRFSIQSTSDQSDYKKYAVISAAAPIAVTPEQCGVWSYPLTDNDEEVVFNMVNTMLLRIQQSGNILGITDQGQERIKQGIEYYKSIRSDIPNSIPFWPLGIPTYGDGWLSLGLKSAEKIYLAVWRLEDQQDTYLLPLQEYKGMDLSIKCSYPDPESCRHIWNKDCGTISITMLNRNSARVFEIEGI